MSTRRGIRWSHDPETELPTIRRHPDAREYLTPDEVKRMVAGERQMAGGDDPRLHEDAITKAWRDDPLLCSTCGGPAGLCEDD